MKHKIFCIGLSRTGTTSLCEALDILGYHTLHFSLPLFLRPEIISEDFSFSPQQKLGPYWRWRRSIEIKAIDKTFDRGILEKYDAFGDLPIPLFFEALDKKFPGSKFIYTYRDEQKWLKSMRWLYEEGAVMWAHGLVDDEIKLATYNTVKYDEKALLESYRNHHARVEAYFKERPDDLLSVKLGGGEGLTFEKLCSFLNVPISDKPFPRSNPARPASQRAHLKYWLNRNIPFFGNLKSKLAGIKKKRFS